MAPNEGFLVTKVKDKIPSLAELGGQQLYPADPNIGASLPLPDAVVN